MPESSCGKCGLSFEAEQKIDLMRAELRHYIESAKPILMFWGLYKDVHQCTTFLINDDKVDHLRTYGGGQWQETIKGSEVDSGRISSLT